jgi:hypothetical protein
MTCACNAINESKSNPVFERNPRALFRTPTQQDPLNMTQCLSARRLGVVTALTGIVLALGACASAGPPPVAAMTTARASVAQAESAGALQAAPVEMLAAREKLAKAEASVRAEKFADARRMAEQATADAELAERKSRAVKAGKAAEELARGNAALEQELARKARP